MHIQKKKKIKFGHDEASKIENIITIKDSNLCNIIGNIDKETEFKEQTLHKIEFSEWPGIHENEIYGSVEMIAKKRTIFKNGLISDYNFYMKKLFYVRKKKKRNDIILWENTKENQLLHYEQWLKCFLGNIKHWDLSYIYKWRGDRCDAVLFAEK